MHIALSTDPTLDLTGFVLAGGRSSRMGQDKALIPFRGTSLLEHQVSILRGIAGKVVVVGRNDLPDHQPGMGPAGGIETALLSTTTELNVILAVDLPNVPTELLTAMIDRLRNSERLAVAVRVGGRIPLCIALRAAARSAVHAYLSSGGRSVQGLLAELDTDLADPADLTSKILEADTWKNLNSLSDLP